MICCGFCFALVFVEFLFECVVLFGGGVEVHLGWLRLKKGDVCMLWWE